MLKVVTLLQQYMKDAGLTEAQLANKSGISALTIQRIFSGETADPRAQTLQDLAGSMGLELTVEAHEKTPQATEKCACRELLKNQGDAYERLLAEMRADAHRWRRIALAMFLLLVSFSIWYILDVRFNGIGLLR